MPQGFQNFDLSCISLQEPNTNNQRFIVDHSSYQKHKRVSPIQNSPSDMNQCCHSTKYWNPTNIQSYVKWTQLRSVAHTIKRAMLNALTWKNKMSATIVRHQEWTKTKIISFLKLWTTPEMLYNVYMKNHSWII